MELNCASNGSHVSLKKSLNPWKSEVEYIIGKRSIEESALLGAPT